MLLLLGAYLTCPRYMHQEGEKFCIWYKVIQIDIKKIQDHKAKPKVIRLDEYLINFDMKYSHDIIVKAKNLTEAKQKAWKRFEKRIKRSMFNTYALRND